MTTPLLRVAAALAISLGALRSEGAQIDRELEEAKALYREARFAQAIAKLERTIGRLELLRDHQARKDGLADAHLHLALSYVALNETGAARESLKQLLRMDAAWRPDPDVHAPKVIDLFADARREVALEPAPVDASPPTPAPAAAPSTGTKKKGGSRAVPIVLGVGGAAAAAVALGASGGGGSDGTPAGAPGPSATPTPTISGPEDIVFLSSSPPPGSTLSIGRRDVLTMMFSVLTDRDEQDVIVRVNFSQGAGGPCLPNPLSDSSPFSLTRGQSRTVTVSVAASGWREETDPRCALPVSAPQIWAYLQHGTCSTRCPQGCPSCIDKAIPVSYTFVR